MMFRPFGAFHCVAGCAAIDSIISLNFASTIALKSISISYTSVNSTRMALSRSRLDHFNSR